MVGSCQPAGGVMLSPTSSDLQVPGWYSLIVLAPFA
jgi:hypothetical protein